MNKDQKLLEEAYQSIYESTRAPLYFGPEHVRQDFLNWLYKQDFEVHEDGSVSIDGDVSFLMNVGPIGRYNSLARYVADRLPFNFRKVTGRFFCPPRLQSLEGAPEYVGKDFMCTGIRFDSLEGAPEVIKGKFDSDQFTDEDYRNFVKKRELSRRVSKELDKDFDIDLKDF